MKLFLEKIKSTLLKRTGIVASKKNYAAWAAKGYQNEPLVSVIIQSHNKSVQVCHILPKLRQFPGVEIVVIDDGSSTDHTRRLASALTGANEFFVRCNDLYENITYDRCLRFVHGRYVALLQDDDDFDGVAWMERAVNLFEQHPKLAVLGGKDGLRIAFEHDRKWAHGGGREQEGDFCFVTAVNRAPMWLNRPLFLERLKHIDISFAPFQFDDYELCARTWLSGLQVGWYDAAFRSLSVGGMRIWNNAFTNEQSEKNGRLLYSLYAEKEAEINRLVAEARQN